MAYATHFLYACVYNVSLDIVVSVGNLSEWIEYENRNINDQINDAMPGWMYGELALKQQQVFSK